MSDSPGPIRLPAVLIADDGSHPFPDALDATAEWLIRDTDLAALTRSATSPVPPLAVDMDSVAGLDGDDAAVDFVTRRLGFRIVLTRRPQIATRVAEIGSLGLLHVLALDSTGLNRALDGHPRREGVGTVISPALVLPHLHPSELAAVPRPILAYGLIGAPEEASAILSLADGVVVRRPLAAAMAAARNVGVKLVGAP
jgi:glycerol-3-phosphate responsive antiterminator